MKRLITHRMAILMVPPGGGVASALDALTSPGKLAGFAKEATVWVGQAIAAVKAAPDNTWGEDDEAIAGEILRRVEDRKRAQIKELLRRKPA